MTRVLIATHPDDVHATIVAEALTARGHEAVLWQGADFPTRQQASITISDDSTAAWEVSGPRLGMTSTTPFDVVWYRRPVIDPVLPCDMHPGDRVVAQRECSTFSRNLWQLVAPDAFWVNPLDSRQRATAKLVQLREATAAGLRIPPTLCSNDPERIRAFLAHHQGQAVYKPFYSAQWLSEDGCAHTFTSMINSGDLPDDDILRLTPGIFQRYIAKEYEVRLTCIGDLLVAAKLLSQDLPSAQVDWRNAFGDLRVVPMEIPHAVEQACQRLLRRLGIVFACLDMIVTPEGDYVFLEANEMGQFLWIEELNPDLRLLDPFCELLAQSRVDFCWRRSAINSRLSDLRGAAETHHREVLSRMHAARISGMSVAD